MAMSTHGPAVRVEFENQISDTRPWDICGCAECEPMRLQWVEFFKRQHDTLLAQKGQSNDEPSNSKPDGELESLQRSVESHAGSLSPGV